MKELIMFVVLSLLKCNGKYYKADSAIGLTDEQAAPLLAGGIVRYLDENDASKLTSNETAEMTLLEAIASLDENDESLYIANGMPKTDVLSEIVGREVSAAERNEAFDAYTAITAEKSE